MNPQIHLIFYIHLYPLLYTACVTCVFCSAVSVWELLLGSYTSFMNKDGQCDLKLALSCIDCSCPIFISCPICGCNGDGLSPASDWLGFMRSHRMATPARS